MSIVTALTDAPRCFDLTASSLATAVVDTPTCTRVAMLSMPVLEYPVEAVPTQIRLSITKTLAYISNPIAWGATDVIFQIDICNIGTIPTNVAVVVQDVLPPEYLPDFLTALGADWVCTFPELKATSQRMLAPLECYESLLLGVHVIEWWSGQRLLSQLITNTVLTLAASNMPSVSASHSVTLLKPLRGPD